MCVGEVVVVCGVCGAVVDVRGSATDLVANGGGADLEADLVVVARGDSAGGRAGAHGGS